MTKKIVILVPGIMGSELYDGKTKVWPGSTAAYVWGVSNSNMEKLLKENLTADNVIRSYYVDQYSDIIDPLVDNLGFIETKLEDLPSSNADNILHVFPYDWRKDNREAARHLADIVNQIAESKPSAKITILAHSMGGLVTRYYLESDELQHHQGFEKISRVIFMGTPHQGAPKALRFALGLEGMLWLTKSQLQQLVSHESFSSIYQLLPTERSFFLRQDKQLKFLDIYTPEVYKKLGLDERKLEDARKFHSQLNPQRLKENMSVFCFYSAHYDTETILKANLSGSTPDVYVETTAPAGDGTVPVLSAWLQGTPSYSAQDQHSKIYASKSVHALLPNLLDVPVLNAPGDEAITICLANEFILKGNELNGLLYIQQDVAEGSDSWTLDLEIKKKEEEKALLEKSLTVTGLNTQHLTFSWLEVEQLEAGEYTMNYQVSIKPDFSDLVLKGKLPVLILK